MEKFADSVEEIGFSDSLSNSGSPEGGVGSLVSVSLTASPVTITISPSNTARRGTTNLLNHYGVYDTAKAATTALGSEIVLLSDSDAAAVAVTVAALVLLYISPDYNSFLYLQK